MQLPAVEQFPLHRFPRLQPDGGCQRERKVNIKTGCLILGTDGLHFYCIFCLHGFKIAYRVATCQSQKMPLPRRTNPCFSPTWVRVGSWPTFPAALSPAMAARCCCARWTPT